MADALRERDKLETELLAVKKDYKARIDLSVSKAAEAAAEYRSGKRFETALKIGRRWRSYGAIP